MPPRSSTYGTSPTTGYDWINSLSNNFRSASALNDPLVQAAGAKTQEQVGNTPYNGQRSAKVDEQTGGGGKRGGSTLTGQTQMVRNPSSFPMPHGESNQWYGKLDEYGSMSAAQDPYTFWDLYGTDRLGLRPGSMTGRFMSQNFNPTAMSEALGYGTSLNGYSDQLAAGTSLANLISQPGTAFFNPAQMVGNVLQALAGVGKNPNGQFNQLSSIILGAGTPGDQLQMLVKFLGEALKGAMPPDALDAYLNYLFNAGQQIVSKAMHSGIASFEKGGNNIGTLLLKVLGPTGGLG